MEKIKALFVAPYEGLKNSAQVLCKNNEYFDLEADVGDLEAGVQIVKELGDRNYDVIISRGGTTELIRRITEKPVVDIELSQYDILHAIKLSQNYSGKIAIVGFPKIIERVSAICGLLGYDMCIKEVNSAEQVAPCLSRLKAEGCSLIIGDMIAVSTAKEMQMNGILITSGSESLRSAFDEAEKICAATAAAKRRASLYRNMLDEGGDIVLALEKSGLVVAAASPRSAGEADMQVIEGWCRAAIEEVLKTGTVSLLRKSGGTLWKINGKRGGGNFVNLAYFYIRRGMETTNIEKFIHIQSVSLHQAASGGSFYGDYGYAGKIAEHIRRLAGVRLPVIIIGEPGTGKDSVAFEICRLGNSSDRTMLTIDCGLLEERQLDYLLSHDRSPLLENGICVYFKRADALGEAAFGGLARYMSDTLLHRRSRVIYSCEEKPSVAYLELSIPRILEGSGQECLTLRLPPLRERMADIPSIVSIYINDLNIALGKQVAGLDRESADIFNEFAWPANITQLKNVLRELILITDSVFISGSDTRRVLQREMFAQSGADQGEFFKGTLEEITINIIRRVLKEEEMNQSSTAKRLGISRSTMWRKLKTK